ncbi:hypothetical protein ACSBR2_035726 [Camellia fascicularis]
MATATVSFAGPRYAPEDLTLPKPWKGLVDAKTGYLYFWNPETNFKLNNLLMDIVTVSSMMMTIDIMEVAIVGLSLIQEHGVIRESTSSVAVDVTQSGKGGSDHSQNVPNEEIGVGHGGSSGRGYGLSAVGNGPSVESYRCQHEITISGDNVPPPLTSFEATGFPLELLREVRICSWEELNVVRCATPL